ncbi:MAG: alanine racemase [Clostridia bacterium]|nr:alanine racemase [Clostridia bacterium]
MTSSLPSPDLRRCWAEVDLRQMIQNYRLYQAALPPKTEVIAVVKANAYGHGDRQVALALQNAGVRQFAVATLAEGLRLRDSGVHGTILILGYTDVSQADTLAEYGLTQTLLDAAYAQTLAQAAHRPITCHYAIDTGMRRIGLNADCPEEAEQAIRNVPAPLVLTGLFTHLCVADTPQAAESAAFTRKQIALFEALADRVRDLRLPQIHCLNSTGGLFYGSAYPLARLGIVLYGLKPDRGNRLPVGIAPALSWKCTVATVKTIVPGDTVGYGRAYRAMSRRTIATLPVGYADGYSRALSDRGFVLIHGRRAPIVGRVCMDQMMVDVTEIGRPVLPGDEAVLLGRSGDAVLTADQMAELIGTIGYEIVCNISDRVPRIFLNAETA